MVDLKKTLHAYFSGSSHNEYFLKIREAFKTGDGEDELRQEIKEQWQEIQDDEISWTELTPVLDRIHRSINLKESQKNRIQPVYKWILKVAAVLMFPIIATGVWFSYGYYQKQNALMNSWSEIVAPGGGRLSFSLPDGTTGWLNGYSKLSFPLLFGKERLVKVSGEAYFNVAHDREKPFIVEIPVTKLRVLGTRFSVTAFADENNSEVVLEEGRIEVQNRIQNNTFTLEPERHLIINNATGACKIENINALNFVAWKDGLLVFRNEQMADVTKRLSRWYNVDIVMNDPKLYEYRFRATFKDENLEEVLNLLKISSPIDYSISDRKMLNDGQFSRRKVTLYLKKGKTNSLTVRR